jgi:tetraacyldisaccharide 4'-kinase
VERRTLGWRTLTGDDAAPPARAFLLAGIARPERFATDVAASGGGVVGHAFFPDHHRFRPDELADVGTRARAAGADTIATTVKDAVRLEAVGQGTLGLPVVALDIAAALTDEARFRARLLAAVGRAA